MAKTKRDLPVLAFKSQQAWDDWLASQAVDSKGLWLKLAKKSSGIASVSKPEAVDIALCHGWIDGQLDSFDDQYSLVRFTPRRQTSKWSERNRTRALQLVDIGSHAPRRREGDRTGAKGRTVGRCLCAAKHGRGPRRSPGGARQEQEGGQVFRNAQRRQSLRDPLPRPQREEAGDPGGSESRNSSRCWRLEKPSIRRSPNAKTRSWSPIGPEGTKRAGVEKYCFISLSFRPFGARTPPRSRPPHPWRLAANWKRAADCGL